MQIDPLPDAKAFLMKQFLVAVKFEIVNSLCGLLKTERAGRKNTKCLPDLTKIAEWK